MRKHPKREKESPKTPFKISNQRLDELIVELQAQGIMRKFLDVLHSDLGIHEKNEKMFEMIESLGSRERRFAGFLIFFDMIIMLSQGMAMNQLLKEFNDAAEQSAESEDDDSNPDKNGQDDGGGSNGESKN